MSNIFSTKKHTGTLSFLSREHDETIQVRLRNSESTYSEWVKQLKEA